ncbi:maltose ABC transporter permease MalF [Hahella sp. CCB-MM4]|uniref:maltose ABC transporter permease MalF n=1 Tax=Hahella sp. (strain CCB-MM4) TaxID=1926491 RepID=UPI000B9C0C9F|nr:maltose ABC transporter permease MalF [Hahella sp. CCB-MM4]OZG75300.1 maltose ABC transporter permease MalF [Hahella sp. CCB-MM4]
MHSHALSTSVAERKRIMNTSIFKWAALGATFLLALYLTVVLYAQDQFAFAVLFLVVIGSALYIFSSNKAYAHRYIYPSIAGMVVFVIFPLIYTIGIGFTNYSASNLLSFERVQEHLLSQQYQTGDERYNFKVYPQGDQYVLQLESPSGELVETPSFSVTADEEIDLTLQPAESAPDVAPLGLKDIVKLKNDLRQLELVTADGKSLRLAGLRNFAAMSAAFTLEADGSLYDQRNKVAYYPNDEIGFYQNADGATLSPGWTVTIGWDNYLRVITDESIREPFLQIFVWTIAFALLTVVFTLALGLLLANILQWDQIGGKGFYRMMLILPYAVPAFISILVFKGLFNQNFGEINLVLEGLFGIRPDWFSDAGLARSMIVIVNTWLGYPYMMLLCMGLLQAIPRDLYEASAMDGATPLDNLFKITLPQIIRPLVPLLIASFAFNFNNFVLIALLTGGAPDIIGATTPAGTTDLLVSYTYRIAFQDSGQNFGLAAAIATVIFLLVGSLSLLNLKLSKVKV